MTTLTRSDVDRILTEARAAGVRPDLRRANLGRADLAGADLTEANLSRANLHEANLAWADLRNTAGVFALGCTPSGWVDLRPLPEGRWLLTVGCWSGTTDDLRTLIAGDNWPEAATPEERARRRPILAALADYADAHTAAHHDWLTAVVERWGTTTEKETHR